MTTIGATRSAYEFLHERAAYFPLNLSPVQASPTTMVQEDSEVAPRLWKDFKVPLFQLVVSGRTYFAAKPIGIKVCQDGPWFFAENESLNVIGTGQTLEEAVLDLEHHIVHFWEYYNSLNHSQVTGDAVRLKSLFSDLLSEAAEAA